MFCEKCGNKLNGNNCDKCGFIKFYNPIPVAVALIPVKDGTKIKLLAVRRNIQPKIGELALPGGFQEIESIETALVREVYEETGITVEILSNEALALSTPDNTRVLLFFETKVVKKDSIDFSFKNDETQEICLIDDQSTLAFPLHEKAVKWFFEKYS